MSESEDDASKTEEPSQKKLDDAKKKGQTISSRELNHFFMILALTAFVMAGVPSMGQKTMHLLAPFLTKPDEIEVSAAGFSNTMRHVAIGAMAILAIPFLLTFLAAIAPSVVQRKWIWSAESIKPKLEKISPLSGFKRVFGMKAIIEFLKNVTKVVIVGIIVVMVAKPYFYKIAGTAGLQKIDMLAFTQAVAIKMLIAVCIMLFLLSIFDYFYQRLVFMKQMRMSKQELKDEYKQQEGDPHIKGKLKQIRREKARQRMMANVPKADVIVTNPTHYSVALQYDTATMAAPRIVAMGTDDVALRIREVAEKHKIILVRNPPLARALYDTGELDKEIPIEHFQAVAKVIGYVYKLKGKSMAPPNKTLNMPPKGKNKKK